MKIPESGRMSDIWKSPYANLTELHDELDIKIPQAPKVSIKKRQSWEILDESILGNLVLIN